MLDLRKKLDCVWEEDLRPVGFDQSDKESFNEWWDRHRPVLGHLHPQIAEQWVYRHFDHSYMGFLELAPITWREAEWLADRIVADVWMEYGGPIDPEFDYKQFNLFGPNLTASAMNKGTWDVPLLVLSTPQGIHSEAGEKPNVRFVVAEGSKRTRYLHAQRHRGEALGPHRLFILETPQIAAERPI